MTVLKCPSCGGEMSLDVLISHNDLRQAMVDLVEKGLALGSLVLRYVALFRPATNRMSADRFAKLVTQLTPDLQRNAITYRGRDWPVPKESWEHGLEAMLEKAAAGKLTLPLDNHHYLYAILVGQADKAEAVAEEEIEQQRRHVPVPIKTAPVDVAQAAARGVPEHIRREIEAVRQGKPLAELRGGGDA